jgi:hypothetical protein
MAGAGRVVQLSVSTEVGRLSHTRHPGGSRVSTRVLAEGRLRPGDGVRIVSAPTV